MERTPLGASPRVSFSRYNQVAPQRVHFSAETFQESAQKSAFKSGGIDICLPDPSPIVSVSRANARKYRERTTFSKDSNGRDAGTASVSSSSVSERLTSGGNAVYNFNKRVLLTTLHRHHSVESYADAPHTDYIYETILGTNTCDPFQLNRSKSDLNMVQGGKSKSAPRTSSIKAPSPATSQTEAEGSVAGSVGTEGSRYRSRRPATTKVVQVGPATLPKTQKQGRGVNGFFPPVKLRDNSFYVQDSKRKRSEMRTPPFVLELAPEEAALWENEFIVGKARAPSAKSSVARSDPSLGRSEPLSSCQSRPYALSMTPPVYPHVASDTSCDDLSSMPRPRMMVSRGELPWVYRQKVKRSMNELSKIMASRPTQPMDSLSVFGYR